MVVVDGNTQRAHPLFESSQSDEVPSSLSLHAKLTRTVCHKTVHKIGSSDSVGKVQLLCRIFQPGTRPYLIQSVELGRIRRVDIVQRLRLHQIYIRQSQHDPVDTGVIALIGPKAVPVFIKERSRRHRCPIDDTDGLVRYVPVPPYRIRSAIAIVEKAVLAEERGGAAKGDTSCLKSRDGIPRRPAPGKSVVAGFSSGGL